MNLTECFKVRLKWSVKLLASCGHYTIRLLFVHRKDGRFFTNYFRTVEAIASGEPMAVLQYRLNLAILGLEAVRCALLFLFAPTTVYDQLVYVDCMQLIGNPPVASLHSIWVFINAAYMMHIFYVRLAGNQVMAVFEETVVHGNGSFARSNKPIGRIVLFVVNAYQPLFMIMSEYSKGVFPIATKPYSSSP